MTARITLACLALGTPLSGADDPYVRAEEKIVLRSPHLAEASGIAASPSDPGRYWFINDSGGTAELHLATSDGTTAGKVLVRGARNLDWEDLASFRLGGRPFLLIADTGDNTSSRPDSTLHIVPEPSAGARTVDPAWTIRFRYDDGPRDCEAIAVDEKAGKIILISKRTKLPVLYELPLKPAGPEIQVAKRIGTIARVLPKGRSLNPYASQPTGLDISADGTRAAVVTYAGAFLFPKKPAESWAAAFSRAPLVLAPHRLRQAEAIAFSRDGKSLHLVSEGLRSPLVTYRSGK